MDFQGGGDLCTGIFDKGLHLSSEQQKARKNIRAGTTETDSNHQ